MAHEYFYLGNCNALAKIHGSERFVCIDTNSWESLIYAQGYPVETSEVSVFKRFLSPGDVFLDIGANFGLYSALASEVLTSRGKIIAFEANPHTYKFTRKTALANRLLYLPQHMFVNKAVGNVNGRAKFSYDPEGLGGGHLRNEEYDAASGLVTVDVEIVTLDTFLPPDMKVDFAKIDVEGNELQVLEGMVDVIRRSPNIRLMLEYYTDTTEVLDRGRAIVSLANSLGLDVCIIEGIGQIRLLSADEIPTGNVYLLLTRTPQDDAKRPSSSLSIRMRGLHYHQVFSQAEKPLLKSDGTVSYRKSDHEDVNEPTLFFGPYMVLQPGEYRVHLLGSIDGEAHLTLVKNLGHDVIAEGHVGWSCNTLDFVSNEKIEDFEIVLRRTGRLEGLDLSEVVIEKL